MTDVGVLIFLMRKERIRQQVLGNMKDEGSGQKKCNLF
jgi:hypothetical protein